MKIALQDNRLLIADIDNVQFSTIKSWSKMKWDKTAHCLIGTADIELLDKLAGIVRLPPDIEQHRKSIHAVQDAVDRERANQKPEPLFNYPVKMPLYSHQIRGANMCLLTFGWAVPPKGEAAL